MTASALWTAVLASYETTGLVTLTNQSDPSATAVVTATGEDAAQGVIDLWPAFAQEAYDASDALHVEVAKQGVIAMLWRRGGSAANIAEVRWEDVFSADGLLSKVKRTGPRARQGPTTNSGVTQRAESVDGQNVRGWSDRESMPDGHIPLRRTTNWE